MGIVFGIHAITYAQEAPPRTQLHAPGAFRRLADATLPKINFWYETDRALGDVKLFGVKLVSRPDLASRRIPKRLVQAYRLAEDLGNPTLRSLFPGLLSRLESPVDTVLREANGRELTKDEADLLDLYRARQRHRRETNCHSNFAAITSKYPKTASTIGALAKFAPRGALGAIAGLSALHAWRIANDPAAIVSVEKYLEDPEYAPGEDEVTLLVESTPVPHLAIRIGDKVYSYGTEQLSASRVEQYLLAEELQQWAKDNQTWPKVEEVGSVTGAFMGLKSGPLARSVQAVTLKIGREKVIALKRKLEASRGKSYDNRTLVNDCSTMICREIGLWNPLVDPAPGLVVTTLSAQRGFNPSVRRVFQIDRRNDGRGTTNAYRNAFINYLEGLAHVYSLGINLPQRIAVELKGDEGRQWWPKDAEHVFAEYRRDAENAVLLDARVDMFTRRALALGKIRTAESFPKQRTTFLNVWDKYMNDELAKIDFEEASPDAEFKEILFHRYKREAFRVARARILFYLDRTRN